MLLFRIKRKLISMPGPHTGRCVYEDLRITVVPVAIRSHTFVPLSIYPTPDTPQPESLRPQAVHLDDAQTRLDVELEC